MQKLELESQGFRVALSKNEKWPSVTIAPCYSEEKADASERIFGIGVSVPLPLWSTNRGSIETNKGREQQVQTSLYLTLPHSKADRAGDRRKSLCLRASVRRDGKVAAKYPWPTARRI